MTNSKLAETIQPFRIEIQEAVLLDVRDRHHHPNTSLPSSRHPNTQTGAFRSISDELWEIPELSHLAMRGDCRIGELWKSNALRRP